MEELLVLKCQKCGSTIVRMNKTCCTPHCCGEEMKLLKANTTDAALEKHVPVVEHKDGKLIVKVGGVEHPMTPEHFIPFVAVVSEGKISLKELKPGEKPVVCFDDVEHGVAYAYCNLHNLWKAEF
ncbi:MAG: desulfoferrodoxin Dfx [Bacilli bacterium]|nr:desulfoferrodoxin Dfx [Bacilli bacterium]